MICFGSLEYRYRLSGRVGGTHTLRDVTHIKLSRESGVLNELAVVRHRRSQTIGTPLALSRERGTHRSLHVRTAPFVNCPASPAGAKWWRGCVTGVCLCEVWLRLAAVGLETLF